jgi:flagellar biosynthetic protein FliR
MVFTADLHHLLFAAMRDSYLMFRPGQMLPVGDFAQMMVGIVGGAFKVGLQLAAPFVVFGLIFNLGQGVLSRLMPQVQIFFVSMPANIYLGFVLLMLLLTPIMMWYLDYFSMGIKEFIH